MQRQVLSPVLRRVKFTASGDFATKKDRETWYRNRNIIEALKNKDNEVLKTEIKNYLIELFQTVPALKEGMADEEYYLQHPEQAVNSTDRLFYSNVKGSKLPAVKEAFEEFKQAHPKAYEWLDRRLDVNEQGTVQAHFMMNGYKDTADTYEKRFRKEVAEQEKFLAQMQEEAMKSDLAEKLKTQQEKPLLLKERTEEERKTLKEEAVTLKTTVESIQDEAALFRMNRSLEAKAECGYDAFQKLSVFRGLCSEKFLKQYGSDSGSKGRFEAMRSLTERIRGYDVSDPGELSDKELVKNGVILEGLSREVMSYRALLAQNEEFRKKMQEEDPEGFKELTELLSRLSAVSDFYRVRKMMLLDPEYVESWEVIEEQQDTDSKSTLRLKEMIALSETLRERAKKGATEDEKERTALEKKIRELEVSNLSASVYGDRKSMLNSMPGPTPFIPSEADPYFMHDQYAMLVAYVEGKDERKEPVTEEEKKEAELAKAEIRRIEEAEAKQTENMKA